MREFAEPWRALSVLLFTLSLFSFSAGFFGKPKCRRELDVAIVGAGLSGAYSAYKLRNKGLDITLFEYSDRIGGRLYTEHLLDLSDLNIELGTDHYYRGVDVKFEELLNDLIFDRKPKYRERPLEEGRVYRRNISLPMSQYVNGDVPFDLTAEEKENQADLLGFLFRKLTGDSLETLTEEKLYRLTVPDGRKLYTLSATDALSLVASNEALSFLFDQDLLPYKFISAADLLDTYYKSHRVGKEQNMMVLHEGMSTVVRTAAYEFLKASSSHSLEEDYRLYSISKEKGRYVLEFARTATTYGNTRTFSGRFARKHFCARKIILALPKFALSEIQWDPLSSDHYQNLLRGTFITHASTVFMSYNKAWWLTGAQNPTKRLTSTELGEVLDLGQSSVSGEHLLQVSSAQFMTTDKQYVIREALNTNSLVTSKGGWEFPLNPSDPLLKRGPYSNRPILGSALGENMVNDQLKNYLHEHLAKAFGIAQRDIPKPENVIAHFWVRYPFGGMWAGTRPGYRKDDLVSGYRRPSAQDDVFVVGYDYSCSGPVGWLDGALSTVDSVINEFF